jgi:hypothetical protein
MTCLEIALGLNYCERKDFDRLITEADEIAAMMSGFSKNLYSEGLTSDMEKKP